MSGVCGTYAGYHKHLSRGMAPCPKCREAKRVYESEKRELRSQSLSTLTHPSNTAWDAGCRCKQCTAQHDDRHIRRYGISPDEFDALLQTQRGGCAICGSAKSDSKGSKRRLHIDHDHACCSGCRECVRGLLCLRCNTWGERLDPRGWAKYAARRRPFAQRRAS